MKITACSYDLNDLLRDLLALVPHSKITRLDPLSVLVDGTYGWNFKLKRSAGGKAVTLLLPGWSENPPSQFYVTWRTMRRSTSVPWHTADIAARINQNRDKWIARCNVVTQQVVEETVPCKICGEQTSMLGTQLCDDCWHMDRSFEYLAGQNPEAARQWLVKQALKLRHPGPGDEIKALEYVTAEHEHYVKLDANGSVPCRNEGK